ncbi:Gnk2-homologous domain [Sesbania bispinosa]|nr:Gnk2-homologous domain [Sesbania bispinosa]
MLLLSKINKPIDSLMALFKLVFFFIFIIFNNFVTATAQDDLNYYCSGDKITPNSAFQLNLRTLLSYLSSNATGNREFYNTTVTGRNHSDTVYGMFMCWGDIPAHLCSQCVKNVTQTVILYSKHSGMAQAQISTGPDPDRLCSLYNQGIIRYDDECMVRYSNHSFFSTADLISPSASCSTISTASNSNLQAGARFEHVVSKIMNEVADEAANFSIGAKKYATKQARISDFQTLYCQVQCTPDLSPQDCRKCLNATISGLQQFCKGNSVGMQSTPSCNIRYDVYPFYRPSNGPAPSGLIPVANHSDSKYSQDPGYLSHNCSSNETMMSTAFLSNLRILFSSLSSNATTKTGFFKTTVDGRNPLDTVHGLFMCRSDVSPAFCQLCILNATTRISLECPSSKEAIIWLDHCLLRYSNRSLSPTVETSPKFHEFDVANSSNPNLLQSFFTWTLAKILNKVVETETRGSTIKNYRTRSEKLNDQQTLYILAQCTPDLLDWDCSGCLQNIFQYEIPWSSLASPEGKVLYPSCVMMFGFSQFYRDGDEAEAFTQAGPPPTTKGKVSFK